MSVSAIAERRAEIVAAIAAGTMPQDEALAALAALTPDTASTSFAITVGASGGLRVVGKGLPFPLGCTQYAEGWETILDHADAIRQALVDGEAYLSRKGDTPEATARKAAHPKRVEAAAKKAASAAKRAA